MPTSKQIEQILARRFQDGNLDFLWHVTGPVAKQDSSTVFRGICPGEGPEIAIKLFSNAEASVQHAALAYAWERLGGDDRLAVPRPVALIEDENLVLMEWVDASPLTISILESPPPLAFSYLRTAGQWLRRFHEMERLPESRLDTDKLLEALTVDISSASLHRDHCLERGCKVLEHTAKEAGKENIRQGVVHGDFKPDNIFISEDGAKGIDFAARFRSTVTADLAHFLNHLMLLTWEPRSIRKRMVGIRRNLRDEFLSGYEEEGARVPAYPLLWKRLHNYLRMYVAQRVRPWSLGASYLRVCLRLEIKWVSSALIKQARHRELDRG